MQDKIVATCCLRLHTEISSSHISRCMKQSKHSIHDIYYLLALLCHSILCYHLLYAVFLTGEKMLPVDILQNFIFFICNTEKNQMLSVLLVNLKYNSYLLIYMTFAIQQNMALFHG